MSLALCKKRSQTPRSAQNRIRLCGSLGRSVDSGFRRSDGGGYLVPPCGFSFSVDWVLGERIASCSWAARQLGCCAVSVTARWHLRAARWAAALYSHAPSAVDMPCGRPSDAGSARQGDFRSSDQSASAAVSCGGRGRVVSGADPWARLVITRESPGTSAAWGNRAHPERLEQVGFGESLSATGGPSQLTALCDRIAVVIHPVCLGSR